MDFKSIYKLAEAASLAFTSLTMHMCLEVIAIWWKDAIAWLWGNRKPVAWIAFGAVTHFFGSFVDNGYWGHAWDWKLKEMPTWQWWFENGVWSNIPFRQFCTTIAAYCYVRGTFLFVKRPHKALHYRMIISFTAGVAYVLITTPNLFN